MHRFSITLTVNGEVHELNVDPKRTLLEVLREELELRGTHLGCDSGDCGACTVMLDGEPVPSCLVLAADADGRQVVTVEGLLQGSQPHPVQQAIVAHGGVQSGYCTPGMVVSSVALLNRNPHPSEQEVRQPSRGIYAVVQVTKRSWKPCYQ